MVRAECLLLSTSLYASPDARGPCSLVLILSSNLAQATHRSLTCESLTPVQFIHVCGKHLPTYRLPFLQNCIARKPAEYGSLLDAVEVRFEDNSESIEFENDASLELLTFQLSPDGEVRKDAKTWPQIWAVMGAKTPARGPAGEDGVTTSDPTGLSKNLYDYNVSLEYSRFTALIVWCQLSGRT
jgi:hypothetical protein